MTRWFVCVQFELHLLTWTREVNLERKSAWRLVGGTSCIDPGDWGRGAHKFGLKLLDGCNKDGTERAS